MYNIYEDATITRVVKEGAGPHAYYLLLLSTPKSVTPLRERNVLQTSRCEPLSKQHWRDGAQLCAQNYATRFIFGLPVSLSLLSKATVRPLQHAETHCSEHANEGVQAVDRSHPNMYTGTLRVWVAA